VKLHAELTFLLGTAANSAVDDSEAAYAAAWPHLGDALIWAIAIACGLLGLCGGLAAASDAVRIVLLPLELSYRLLAFAYRLHLRGLRAMWRLMRGAGGREAAAAAAGAARLRLLRRRRAATSAAQAPALGSLWGNNAEAGRDEEVTAEHVIVGVLLFTPLLALLPTTAAWYLLGSCLYLVPAAVCTVLRAGAALAERNLLCALVRRLLRPSAYPGERLALGVATLCACATGFACESVGDVLCSCTALAPSDGTPHTLDVCR
jgi:hypothetical protein